MARVCDSGMLRRKTERKKKIQKISRNLTNYNGGDWLLLLPFFPQVTILFFNFIIFYKCSCFVWKAFSFLFSGVCNESEICVNTLVRDQGCVFSNLRASRLVLKTHNARTMPGRRSLTIKAEVKYVNAEKAKELVAAEGYTILDVRDKTQFDRAHIKSCYHVPLFVLNQDNDPGTIIKRTLHNNFAGLLYGLPFTKLNPEFVQSVKSQIPPETKLLVVCQEGLRSAAAASKLEQSGFSNIACITSGLQTAKPGTFDSVGSTELQNAGKAGLVTIQGQISAVLGTVLIFAYLFITFFPDQAEKLFQLVPAA